MFASTIQVNRYFFEGTTYNEIVGSSFMSSSFNPDHVDADREALDCEIQGIVDNLMSEYDDGQYHIFIAGQISHTQSWTEYGYEYDSSVELDTTSVTTAEM